MYIIKIPTFYINLISRPSPSVYNRLRIIKFNSRNLFTQLCFDINYNHRGQWNIGGWRCAINTPKRTTLHTNSMEFFNIPKQLLWRRSNKNANGVQIRSYSRLRLNGSASASSADDSSFEFTAASVFSPSSYENAAAIISQSYYIDACRVAV